MNMKQKIKLTHRLGAKIAAVILCIVASIGGMLSGAGVFIMAESGFYNNFGSISQESLQDSFLNIRDYGYYDLTGVYEDLAQQLDSWMLFCDLDQMMNRMEEYIEEYYPAGENGFYIRIVSEDGADLFCNGDPEMISAMDNRQYQLILCGSLQQYLERYGYDAYYIESYPVDIVADENGEYLVVENGVFTFTLYKGNLSYQIYKSDRLQMFYMDTNEAFRMLGGETIMEMLDSSQAYVYSYNLTQDLTDQVTSVDDLQNMMTSSRLVFTNLYSKLQEDQRVLNLVIYLDKAQILTDYGEEFRIYSWFYQWRYSFVVLLTVCLILFLASFVFLLFSCGHKGETDEIHLNVIDRLPTDLYLLMMFLLCLFLLVLHDRVLHSSFARGAVICLYMLLMAIFCVILSCAARLKARTFWRGSITGRFCCWLWKWVRMIVQGLPLIWKKGIFIGTAFLLNAFMCMVACSNLGGSFMGGFLAIFCLSLNLAMAASALVFMMGYKNIQTAAEKMAEGELDYQLDTARLHGDLRCQGETMNKIGSNLEVAVEKQMKSERMKTELITNVSHDIKTPLTSIINYVDLLKKEELPGDAAKQYLEVIDRQSARLKKLIVDLIEASKASTGNLEVNLMPMDVNELLLQTTAEYAQRMEEKNLELVLSLLPETGHILADGRHIWRVLDNVFNNACKYSLAGSRIYIDLLRTDGQIVISVKNISSSRLNISADELMERFVRGDSSRNTEGSGLGLSIAKSLTELQGGSFMLEIDGDLFKCILSFPEINE